MALDDREIKLFTSGSW